MRMKATANTFNLLIYFENIARRAAEERLSLFYSVIHGEEKNKHPGHHQPSSGTGPVTLEVSLGPSREAAGPTAV